MAFNSIQQRSADRLAVFLGSEIKKYHPSVPELARFGKTQKEIAQLLLNNSFRDITSLEVMKHAVGYSLKGNDDPDKGRVYYGTIPADEYNQLTKLHRTHTLERAMSSKGNHPWLKEEEKRLIQYTKRPEFRYRNVPSPTKIAKALNSEFNNQRTKKSVYEKLKRLSN
jgi:hypothetical protein